MEALRRQKQEGEGNDEKSLGRGRSREESDMVFSPSSERQSRGAAATRSLGGGETGTPQTQVSEIKILL